LPILRLLTLYVCQPYSDPYAEQYGNADTQVFIYRVTLPGYSQPSVKK